VEELGKSITKGIVKNIENSFQSFSGMLFDYRGFFLGISKNDDNRFLKASIFALTVSMLLTILKIPVLKISGISTDIQFVVLDTTITWLLLVIYGFEFWLSAKIIGGKAKLELSLVGFFYTTCMLVFIRLFELPKLLAKYNEKISLSGMFSVDVTDKVGKISEYISNSIYASVSNWLVFVGYIFFGIGVAIMFQEIHCLRVWRSIFATILGIILLSMTVLWFQNPLEDIMIFAFKI